MDCMEKFIQLLNKYKKMLLLVTTVLVGILTAVGFSKGIFTDQTKMEAVRYFALQHGAE